MKKNLFINNPKVYFIAEIGINHSRQFLKKGLLELETQDAKIK